MVALAEMCGLAGIDRHDAPMLRALADAIRPRERMRPSAWAERNVSLTPEVSPEKSGPWSNTHFPWTRCALDLEHDNPDKCGDITMKSAQIGMSIAKLVRRACKCATDPGPFLYLINVDTQAKHFVAESWTPIVDSAPSLRRLFDQGGVERREVLLERPIPGGRMDFAGAGSPGNVSSRTYREIDIDEFDQVEDLFPARYGGVFSFVQGRFRGLRGATWLSAWSHPTKEGVGIHRVWRDLSDQGRWVFDCPHCGAVVAPTWKECVRFLRTIDDGRGGGTPDPESVVFECPSCRHVITDAERQRAVWPAEAGGTGRRLSALAPEEAARRQYAGLAVSGLCDPYRTIAWFARQFVALPNDKERQSFFNVQLGEPASGTPGQAMDPGKIRALLEERVPALLPGGRTGVQYLCTGTDVQAPKDFPTLYVATVAFGAHGHDYLVGLDKVGGFAAYCEYLASFRAEVDDGAGGSAGVCSGGGVARRTLGVSAAGIDDGFETGQVKDTCRLSVVYSHATSARVELVPVRFATSSSLNRDHPWVMRRDEKRLHPGRPELGMIDMFDMHRHSLVDRVLQKLQSGTLHIACVVPAELEAHLTSQVLTPKKQIHTNWQETELEWDLSHLRRDDWLMAIVYAYAVAVMKRGLDRIHLHAMELPAGGAPRVKAPVWGRR